MNIYVELVKFVIFCSFFCGSMNPIPTPNSSMFFRILKRFGWWAEEWKRVSGLFRKTSRAFERCFSALAATIVMIILSALFDMSHRWGQVRCAKTRTQHPTQLSALLQVEPGNVGLCVLCLHIARCWAVKSLAVSIGIVIACNRSHLFEATTSIL